MAGLTIAWEYLTGYAVATDPADRDRAEWPPHPARVFMALAAAWFETGEPEDEGVALRELERLGPPELILPKRSDVFERSSVTLYVPVNDPEISDTTRNKLAKGGLIKDGTIKDAASLLPTNRLRQPRSIPRSWLGDSPCQLHWPNINEIESHIEALDRLCARVTRIGHSSSLVRMWVAHDPLQGGEVYTPSERITDIGKTLRTVSPPLLNHLRDLYGEPVRRRHEELTDQVEKLKIEKRAIHGRGSTARKAAIDERLEPLSAELGTLQPRNAIRPSIGTWTAYAKLNPHDEPPTDKQSAFDHDLAILRVTSGRLPATAGLRVTSLLRKAVIKRVAEKHKKLPWINGHDPNGGKRTGDDGHVAYAPLVNVGHEHSDGALLGIAIVFPNAWKNLEERDEVFSPLLGSDTGIVLKVKRGPHVATLQPIDFNEARWTLTPEAWTASPRGACVWASATPVVLDRFPKAERSKDRGGWTDEVARLISAACERVKLPPPLTVEIDTTSWLTGAPRAFSKRRPLRGQPGVEGDAPLGDGYPFYPAKTGTAPRPQVHARIEFAEPVVGPVLIGAGRFLGYGLFKPLPEGG